MCETMSDVVRMINGLPIERLPLGNGSFLWRAVERKPPTEMQHFDDRSGETLTTVTHHDPKLIWSDSINVEAIRARYAHVRFRELNPYEPDSEHDEYEQLLKISTYFAAKFAAQFHIKPREPIG
jgi:hypothetical protein